jgi:hypothetical protein
MTIDLSAIVQEAFAVLKEDADELAKVSVRIKDEKYKLADLTQKMLEHLCEVDLIDLKMEGLAKSAKLRTGHMATHATLAMPENRIEAAAYQLNEWSDEDLIELVPFLRTRVKAILLERLTAGR